jgi:PPK2 family polyphosphate:nucleotide phosphotransferase
VIIDTPYLVKPGKPFKLSDRDTNDRGDFDDKDDAGDATDKLLEQMADLQEKLYAQNSQALLIVLQAMDAGGKDGSIEHVFSSVNPQGCQITSFKRPTELELAHDYLWRIHSAAPRKGMIGIFNRSHYESVLVERVRDLVPKAVWKKRYDHINDFERMLVDEGTTILKFFLHISKDEQRERLEARLQDPTKNWKFNPGDLDERKLWDNYQAAYQDAIEKCSTEWAPWYVVPADRKWYRNWVLSDVIVRAMKKMDPKFPKAIEGIEKYRVE